MKNSTYGIVIACLFGLAAYETHNGNAVQVSGPGEPEQVFKAEQRARALVLPNVVDPTASIGPDVSMDELAHIHAEAFSKHPCHLIEVAVKDTDDGDTVHVLVLQGVPIGEPVAQRGPFVMTTQAEIAQAYEDYRRTQFGGWPWAEDAVVFPREQGRFADVVAPDGTKTRSLPPQATPAKAELR